MAQFEGQERRMPKINACLKAYGMETLEDARDLCLSKGIDVEKIVKVYSPSRLKMRFGLIPWAVRWR